MAGQNSQAEALLKHIGLTEYEAKAYLTLLTHGMLNAERVSVLAGIPLPRVYDTMASLSSRGLIFVSKIRPQTFRAMDPNQLPKILKEDEQRRMEERVKSLEVALPQFLSAVSGLPTKTNNVEEEAVFYIKRQINVRKLWEDANDKAESEILIFAGDMSWINKTIESIKKLLKRGVKYKVLFSKTDSVALSNLKKLVKIGIDAKYATDIGTLRGLIVDGSKVSLLQVNPKPGFETTRLSEMDPDAEKYASFTDILINNRAIADVFRRYFLLLWQKAQPAERWLNKKR